MMKLNHRKSDPAKTGPARPVPMPMYRESAFSPSDPLISGKIGTLGPHSPGNIWTQIPIGLGKWGPGVPF